MDNRIKILLPTERGVTSENIDLFLNLDLYGQFNEFKKERFDNDFDLAAQFVKERNTSRDFIVYGEIDSTVIDCVDVPIRVYSDSGRTDLISVIRTTHLSYNTDNVFGKKKGKYYIKILNCPHEFLYFKILSNNFSYKDQLWEQRLVFRDADNNVVPYGTQTVDINAEGNTVQIDNDFPFFFNKHWIKNDYRFIEEKKSKVSFSVNAQTLREGESGSMNIFLDKPSPFGLEIVKLIAREDTASSDFIVTQTFNDVGDGNSIISSAPDALPQFAGKMCFVAQIPVEKTHLISSGVDIRILDGSYVGYHTILLSTPIVIGSNTDLYFILTSADYNDSGTNNTPMNFRAGSTPDMTFELNGNLVDLPINISWQRDERVKQLSFTANTDFEIEFTEYVDLELTDLLNVRPGRIMESRITMEDNTVRNRVELFFGSTHQNYVHFTGRTFHVGFNQSTLTMPSMSVLRNGYRFENRNEEFYPSDGYTLKITNKGNRTIFPVNSDLGVYEETLFGIGETKSLYIPVRYAGTQRHKIQIKFPVYYTITPFTGSTAGHFYSINGRRTYANSRGYLFFKNMIDHGPGYDWYDLYNLEKPFEAEFNETGLTVTLTSKSPGIRLDFDTNDPWVTATTLTNFVEKSQLERSLTLFSNSNEGMNAAYSFRIEKNGFRPLDIPRQDLLAGETAVPYYLTTSYSNIMRPYYDDLQQPYYGSASTIDDQFLQYTQIDFAQPTYMPKGNAFINGVALLADNILPMSTENLTNYGLGENMFLAAFLPQRITPLVGTFENIVEEPSKTGFDVIINSNSFYNNSVRGFDFNFGNVGNETRFRITGNTVNFWAGASYWWNNIMQAYDENNLLLANATLRERLDTGNSNNAIAEGPISGTLLDQYTIRMIAKEAGNNVYIDNIQNFIGSSTNSSIYVEPVIPHLIPGDFNPANNGLGGFSVAV